MRITLAAATLVMAPLLAVLAEPPPKPERPDRPPGSGGGRSERGDRGDWRGGGLPGYGRPPMRHDGFDKLPEEEKKRVREALDKVWSRPEVIEARDRAMRANEEMRAVIRQSLAKNDPEVAAILARIEPKDPFDPREMPPLPPADSAEFPKAMVQRLGLEMLAFSRSDRREETKKLHERLIAQPEIQEAVRQLEATRGEERIQALQKLRKLYRDSAIREFQAARERRSREEEGKPSSDAPPSKP